MGETKVNVFDVALYILGQTKTITVIRLQRLVYYSQAWSLVWDEELLFNESIEAWAGGPIVRILYEAHKGKFKISAKDIKKGGPSRLTKNQKDTVDRVLDFYKKRKTQWLTDLVRMEEPWKITRDRAKLGSGERGSAIIKLFDMHEYYSRL